MCVLLFWRAAEKEHRYEKREEKTLKGSCFVFEVKMIPHLHHDGRRSCRREADALAGPRPSWYTAVATVRGFLINAKPREALLDQRTLYLKETFKKFSLRPFLFRQRRLGLRTWRDMSKSFSFLELNSISVPSFSRLVHTNHVIILPKESTQILALQAIVPEIRTRIYHFIFQDLA